MKTKGDRPKPEGHGGQNVENVEKRENVKTWTPTVLSLIPSWDGERGQASMHLINMSRWQYIAAEYGGKN